MSCCVDISINAFNVLQVFAVLGERNDGGVGDGGDVEADSEPTLAPGLVAGRPSSCGSEEAADGASPPLFGTQGQDPERLRQRQRQARNSP